MRLVLAFSIAAALLGQDSPVFQGRSPGRQQQPVASNCSVDGFVVNATTSEPVPRAHITLMGQGGQASVTADSSGRWSFSGFSCGVVQIMATRPGFLQGNSGQPKPASMFHPLTVSSESPLHDVKIELTPQSVLAGKVLDDQGDPVQSASVTALSSRVIQGRRSLQQTGTTMTNDLGEFRLAGMQSGKYIFCARSMTPHQPITNDPLVPGESCYPGPVDGGSFNTMDVATGRDVRLDFTLPRTPAVHVRGTLTGMPANGGVGLTLMKRGSIGAAGSVAHQANIRVDGKFEINGVLPGSYLLNCNYFEAGKRLTARVPVEVGSADVEGLSVHLDQGFSVSGTVRYESKSGAAPTGQFNMNFHSADPGLGGGGIQWNKDHTAFTIPDLPPGSYRMDGFVAPPFYLKSAMLGGRDVSREEVQLGQSAGPIDVILSDESGNVEGQVMGPDDQPAASSWVMILQNGRAPRSLMTGQGGHFKATALAPGDYRVYAWDDIQQVEYENPDWMKHYTGVPVTVAPSQTAQIDVKQASAKEQ